jgi:hypothetical protein
MALQPFVGPWWHFFSFLIVHTVGRTPGTGDQPVARPLPAHTGEHKRGINTQTFIPQVGLEPRILVSERAKTIHALNCAVTVIDWSWLWYSYIINIVMINRNMQVPTLHFLVQLKSVTAAMQVLKEERVRADAPSQMLGSCVCKIFIIFIGNMRILEPDWVAKRTI